jgi:hypothetical protein
VSRSADGREDDRVALAQGGADHGDVGCIGVAGVARAESQHRIGVLGDGSGDGVGARGFPFGFRADATDDGDALAEFVETPAGFVVVRTRDTVEIDEGAAGSAREDLAERRLSGTGRSGEREPRAGSHDRTG